MDDMNFHFGEREAMGVLLNFKSQLAPRHIIETLKL